MVAGPAWGPPARRAEGVPLAAPLSLTSGAKVTLGIRPEHVVIASEGGLTANDFELAAKIDALA